MRARYYDPEAGRFISEDPLGFEGGGVNLYVYGANNPIIWIDPCGRWYINVSGGYWGGATGGLLIGPEGVSPYIGGGLVTPGISGSITWSPDEASSGWNVAMQVSAGIVGQYGYSFGDGGGKFWEIGAGWLPGATATAYYVFGESGELSGK